ncbi:hypothetical protein RYX56_04690 [Alkalihalophilus lindianensis]|uniref:Uncharacterized protein n=1 Tax=Alkalihalophilus lindianensis TaxID=1630542 RepID=A0ABU3X7R6_9BACI|nr:hypothetical protein [Alkalihalophilus lindianensis]MDV2683672.1 hypothetical protein [Alkalihalophilus lindianensis]
MSTMIDQFSSWLDKQKGNTLSIQKGEHETGMKEVMDIDLVSIQLDSVSLRESEQASIDDYIPNKEIILHGTGQVHGDEKDSPLPEDCFEIPVDDSFQFQGEGKDVQVHTDKAIYRISSQ